jgi:hypothetical protein
VTTPEIWWDAEPWANSASGAASQSNPVNTITSVSDVPLNDDSR